MKLTLARYAVLWLLAALVGVILASCDTRHIAEVCIPLDSIVTVERTDSTDAKLLVFKTECE